MPKSHKDFLKRQLGHASYNLDQAGEHITNVVLEFQPVHPEMCEPLLAILEGIVLQQDVLAAFAKQAWGMDNPDWIAWRNEPN